MLFQKGRETRAANFFFTFDDEGEVAGQGRAGFEIGFDGFEVCEILTFVVARAAREHRAPDDARLERWRFPEFERLGRLDVVVAVNDIVWLPAFARLRRGKSWGLGDDDGMPGSWTKLRTQSNLAAVFHQPFGAGFHVGAMLWLRGNAGETDVFAQLVHEARLMVAQIIQHQFHAA